MRKKCLIYKGYIISVGIKEKKTRISIIAPRIYLSNVRAKNVFFAVEETIRGREGRQ